MKRNKKLVPPIKPLTPLPPGFYFEAQRPVSDTKTEALLYELLLRERDKSARILKELRAAKADAKAKKAYARTRRLTQLKPAPLDRPAKRGKL